MEEKIYPILVLAIYALLCKYENEKVSIQTIFENTDLFIEEKEIKDILQTHNIELENNIDIEEEKWETYGISSKGKTYEFTEDGKFILKEDNPFIICSLINQPTTLLNTIIHELNHLIKSDRNSIEEGKEENTQSCILRSGLNYYHLIYDEENDILTEYDYFSTLDEAINTIQTTEIIQNILTLDGITPDIRIQKWINFCKNDHLERDIGYDESVKIIRPLWENKSFKKLIEENIIEGNIDKIIKEIDKILGEGSFIEIANSLDDLEEIEEETEERKKIIENLEEKIKEYNQQTLYIEGTLFKKHFF